MIKALLSRSLNRLSLKFILVVPFTLQITVIIGLIGWLSYLSGQAAIQEMANQLRQELTEHIKEKVATFLDVPTTVNHFNQLAFEHHEIDVNDIDNTARHLWRQLKFFPSLTYISYTNHQGYIISAYRDFVTKELRIFLANETTQRAHQQYATDEQGNRTHLIKSVPNFDGRTRVWFKATLAAGKPTWYPVYKYYSLDDLGVGLGTPVYKNGNFQGMFTADIALSQISEFLRTLNIGKSGVAFVTEADGSLIASSYPQKLFTMQGTTAQRLKATDSAHPLIRITFAQLQQQFPQLSNLQDTQQADFTADNQTYFLQIMPVRISGNLNWWIVVAIPEADFMQHIDDNHERMLQLALLAFLIAILVGLLTARWIIQPILTLNNAAQVISTGQWEHVVPLKQRQDELGQLAEAFNQMAEQLRTLFTKLETNEARLKQFLEAMPIGVMVLHSDGRIHYINQWATKLLGRGIEPLIYPNRLPEIYQAYIAGTQQLYPVERMPIFRALHGEFSSIDDMEIWNGTRIVPIEVWGTPLFDEHGKILYSIAVFQDITERKQAIEDRIRLAQEQEAKYAALRYTHEIELKNAQLIQLNQDKNEFLGIAAHDLKNPLAGILGAAELIIESGDNLTTEEITNYAEMIAEASGQMVDLISNLLDVNQIESQKLSVKMQQIDLTTVLHKLLQIYLSRAAAKNIQIHCNLAESMLIWADGNVLRQILDNIISNALKYSPSNRNVYIRLISLESCVRCEVQDEGPGLSVEDQQKLFGKFTRLSARPTAGENSTGLGLFIVKKLVEAIHGKVWCESELGRGACFIIEFSKSA